MMENTAIVLIVITLFLLVIIVGLLTVLIYKIVKQSPHSAVPPQHPQTGEAPHPDIARSQLHPEILMRMKDLEKFKPKRSDLFCPNHSEEPGEVGCAICDRLFCKACVRPFKSMHLCKEHYPLIMRHEWEEVLTLKTSSHDPESGVRLYEMKKQIFQEQHLPTYIETHYKINVDHDYIETYLVVFAMKENVESVKNSMKEFA